MKLELTYTCTKAESEEAQALHQGKRSKWWGLATQSVIAILGIWTLYTRIKNEMPRNDLPVFLAIVAAALLVFFIFKRAITLKENEPVRLDVSDRELVFNVGGSRTAMPWQTFGQCLESPNLFVLVDRLKSVLFTIPKRAFPDDAAQAWFRALAKQAQSVAPAEMAEALAPARFMASHGISFTRQLKYRDYLNRNFTSWRMKGFALFVFLMVTVMNVAFTYPADAKISRLHAYLFLIGVMVPMFLIIICLVTLFSWYGERKLTKPRHMLLTDEGVEFADQHGRGATPWSEFKYYLENRWSFFVWNPRTAIWLMFPKREFASVSDLEQLRTIVQTKLVRSRWFYL